MYLRSLLILCHVLFVYRDIVRLFFLLIFSQYLCKFLERASWQVQVSRVVLFFVMAPLCPANCLGGAGCVSSDVRLLCSGQREKQG
jgi:hypothetical protein